jgi:type IV secretion system protein VirD4
LLPEDEARRLPLEEIVMVIDAQMPIRARRIEYFNDPFFKRIHSKQSGELPFPERKVPTSVGKNAEAKNSSKDQDHAAQVETPASPPEKKVPDQGRLPIDPFDRPDSQRESVLMAVAKKQRSSIRTTNRKKAKALVALEEDQQRQVELDLATQVELTLEAPTEADVSELESVMGDLTELKNSLPDEAAGGVKA